MKFIKKRCKRNKYYDEKLFYSRGANKLARTIYKTAALSNTCSTYEIERVTSVYLMFRRETRL